MKHEHGIEVYVKGLGEQHERIRYTEEINRRPGFEGAAFHSCLISRNGLNKIIVVTLFGKGQYMSSEEDIEPTLMSIAHGMDCQQKLSMIRSIKNFGTLEQHDVQMYITPVNTGQLANIHRGRSKEDHARASTLTIVLGRGTLDTDSKFTPLSGYHGDVYTFEFICLVTSKPMYDKGIEAQYYDKDDPYAEEFTKARKDFELRQIHRAGLEEEEKRKVGEARRAEDERSDREDGGVFLGDFSLPGGNASRPIDTTAVSTVVVAYGHPRQSRKRSREEEEELEHLRASDLADGVPGNGQVSATNKADLDVELATGACNSSLVPALVSWRTRFLHHTAWCGSIDASL
ncbi:hypothetical protein LTR78_009214 [Recurvomyces mirabilis]|uniref:Uncharacterized protein n=1 Tax=Recurvomyces mirabilis TaxID=574656 RepID=A0AAE0TTX2_9PEZI|nr:hypothetical protein LTR78_009214 [Recurvomyces mirabilis]KAK5155626.1 hypothetical protein LTS14_005887 [Recurvomyces mirabilis]